MASVVITWRAHHKGWRWFNYTLLWPCRNTGPELQLSVFSTLAQKCLETIYGPNKTCLGAEFDRKATFDLMVLFAILNGNL